MSRSVSRLLLVIVNIICIVNVYCGFNGTNIEPREQNPINHQFMLWNKLNFVCMTCFNESGNIYYYHPKIDFDHRQELNASVLVKLIGVEPTLQFYHNNKSFVFVNNSKQVILVGERFLVNESLYFDGMGPYRLSIFSQMNKTNVSFQFNITSNSGQLVTDTNYSWLDSPFNSTIVLGPLFMGPHYFRFIKYANATVSPVVALRFNNLSSLGYPRYFPASKTQVCPTKAPFIVTQTCKPEIKTVTIIKTITPAKEDKKVLTATPSEPPQLLECKQQLNVFIVLCVVVSCLFLLVIMIMMCRYTKQAQKQAKSSVY
uniref:Putative transmembrane protein n=1 Tax=Serpentovirinae sp. TaxID=2661817 RepID=A0A5P9K4U0_9NIDO|nr:putative transmembrane protein [Serpentovirinae sp.]